MSECIKIDDLETFDVAEFLGDDDAIAEYLSAVIDDDDPALLAAVVGDIARAKGMTEISRQTGITREALYKALRPGAHPRFETINRVCGALGVRLKVVPASPPPAPGRPEWRSPAGPVQHLVGFIWREALNSGMMTKRK